MFVKWKLKLKLFLIEIKIKNFEEFYQRNLFIIFKVDSQ